MELNEAYEALESMRRLNLEVQCCQTLGIPSPIDHTVCTTCLMLSSSSSSSSDAQQQQQQKQKGVNSESKPLFPRLRRLTSSSSSTTTTTTTTSTPTPKKASEQCLTCAAPSCSKHASSTFRQQGITLCENCEQVFSIDFLYDCLTSNSEQRRQKMFWLLDLYDRCVLLLRYADQEWIDPVADALEESQARRNKVTMGGSTAGLVSGVLGVAAALTLWTPAGPPLLIASLLFGGSATAVQTGADVRHEYFLEPAKVGNRILALHGMILSILTITGTLRDAALLDHQVNYSPNDGGMDGHHPNNDNDEQHEDVAAIVAALRLNHVEHRDMLLAEATQSDSNSTTGSTATTSTSTTTTTTTALLIDRTALAAEAAERQIESSAAASANGNNNGRLLESAPLPTGRRKIVRRNTRYASRVGAGVMRTARLARFAGGALAAASLIVEASSMSHTIKAIQAGSPSEKGRALRKIQLLLPKIPSTVQLERESFAYLKYMQTVRNDATNPMSQEEAIYLVAQVVTPPDAAAAAADEEQDAIQLMAQVSSDDDAPNQEEEEAHAQAETKQGSSTTSTTTTTLLL